MRIACLGGGPAGLAFAIRAKRDDPRRQIAVFDRNPAGATYGFGVVLSDEAMAAIEELDADLHAAIVREGARWTEIDVKLRGRVHTSGGHGFTSMSRTTLITLMQQRALELGVALHHDVEAPDPRGTGADLVVISDGANSTSRAALADRFAPHVEMGACRFMWLATDKVYEAFTFVFVETPVGVLQVHAYPYEDGRSTFIVEMREQVWRDLGLDAGADADHAPGESDEAAVETLAELLADELEGHRLYANNSRWISFPTVTVESWQDGKCVLIGDAAHTAHFSIGSATKLACEDAEALARALATNDDVATALAAYEAERRPLVESTQRAAAASREWFESLPQYLGQDDERFVFNLLTRSRRITYDNLRMRDPGFVDAVDAWFAAEVRRAGHAVMEPSPRPPMFMPFRLRGVELINRVVVSPMDMYVANDGLVGDFHLVHLGARAMGGAGLVMTEMVCTSPDARITPGCGGIWNDEQANAWRGIVDFVHERSKAKIGLQLGHAGRKGSTKLMWEGIDDPLETGNWPLMAPSAIAYREGVNQVPREMDRRDMDRVRDSFVEAARRGARAGFDLLELHMAHGYLLSSFLTPVSNVRTDEYGGGLANRARFPLEVFDAVRGVWPEDRPMSVRISATDWVEDGFDVEDAVAFSHMLAEHGCDLVDVSTGQTTPDARPRYGRSFQTPFADRIRNEVAIATMAVGAISSHDDVNSIILAGRADLCAIGRPHLYDPAWTLHAAADQGYDGPGVWWPEPYRAGSRRPQTGRRDLTAEPSRDRDGDGRAPGRIRFGARS